MLFFIKSKCITFIAQKTGIIHWFEIKIQQTHRKRILGTKNCKMRDSTIFNAKKHCRKSLTGRSPSCSSNVNYKLQTWPQGRGHVTFCGLRISMKNLMLKVSNMGNNTRGIFLYFFIVFLSLARLLVPVFILFWRFKHRHTKEKQAKTNSQQIFKRKMF